MGNQANQDRLAEAGKIGTKASAVFDSAKSGGASATSAFLKTMWEEPGDLALMFTQGFVESELEPMTKVMAAGGTAAGLLPHPGMQAAAKTLSGMATGTDFAVGLLRGDEEKITKTVRDFAIEQVVSGVAGGAGIKSSDGRVAPMLMKADGAISKAAAEIFVNNALVTGGTKFLQGLFD